MIAGLGNGLSDSAWNAWIGNLPRATEMLGFMHACYGVGAVISPLIATAMITRYHLPWFTYYYVMVSSPRSQVTEARRGVFETSQRPSLRLEYLKYNGYYKC